MLNDFYVNESPIDEENVIAPLLHVPDLSGERRLDGIQCTLEEVHDVLTAHPSDKAAKSSMKLSMN